MIDVLHRHDGPAARPTLGLWPLVLGLLLTACSHPAEPPAHRDALPPRKVHIATATRTTRPVVEPIMGTVTARTKPVVSAKVSGTITFLGADVGDRVEVGQVLGEIEAREIKARLDQAIPQLERARQDEKRLADLLAQHASSQQEYDDAAARVRTMEATVEEARTMLGYTRVTSPITGLVRARRAEVGDMALAGHPLFELEGLKDFRLEAGIPESLIGALKVGDMAPVTIGADQRTVKGRLSEIAPGGDPLSRTFLARYDLETTTGLISGQFGRLLLPVGEAPELTIPRQALVRRGQLESVFVVDSGRARLRLVRSGARRGDAVCILSGISEGDRLVTSGASLLEDGQAVEVLP